MHIWLITVGEPLPINGSNDRLFRTGLLAELLSSKGHEVIWWTSTFDHSRKEQRFNENTVVNMKSNYKIALLHSPVVYKKNVSLNRIINHYLVSMQFRRCCKKQEKPDIILCSLPTIELSKEAIRYGYKRRVPVVLDARDLWPDIFLRVIPKWSIAIGKVLLYPMFRDIKRACSNAAAITGITPEIVQWGVNYAGREITKYDKDFPMGYSKKEPGTDALLNAQKMWEKYKISDRDFILCFFGSISHQMDILTVIKAAIKLQHQNRKFKFVICGNGDKLDEFKEIAKGYENIIFPGWVDAASIWTLMRMSTAGLTPYYSNVDFIMSIPNKPIEYFSARLPVISSLNGGVLEKLLSENNCGVTYSNGDADSLASILIDFYDNREKVTEMSNNAYRLFEKRFIAENVYSEMATYLENIANK